MTLQIFLLWLLPGIVSTAWLLYFMADNEPIETVTIGEMLGMSAIALLGIALSWVTVLMAVCYTWDEKRIGHIVIWKRSKPKPKKVSEATLRKTAKEHGYTLKKDTPLKGIE